MSSVGKSVGGFVGIGNGNNEQAPGGQFGNSALDALNKYVTDNPDSQALDPTKGSQYATQQVQNNGVLGGLFGSGGQLDQAEGKLTDLNSQGFQLTPDDQTLYGQTSGNIARMFGQQGNQASQDLASRGLASAPSGAAGAMFSGLAGNQNEMLANAQQQIMQQRVTNTLQQIGQQQQMVQALGSQGANDINQQYGRQLSGAQQKVSGLASAAGLQENQNAQQNNYNMQAADFDNQNRPKNIGDFATSGFGQGIQAGSGGAFASMFGGGGGASPTTAKSMGAGSGAMSGSSGMMSAAALA